MPSAVVPLEWSVLLHSQVGEGAIVEQVERHVFSFDPRLHDRN